MLPNVCTHEPIRLTPQTSLNDKAILMLPGHRTEVFVCSFNPQRYTQLATGYAYNSTLIFTIYVFTYE